MEDVTYCIIEATSGDGGRDVAQERALRGRRSARHTTGDEWCLDVLARRDRSDLITIL